MVALNYQTDDQPMHINTAMFEENGSCGFVCKPEVLWDQSHLMYRRFNPLEKEFDGLHSSQIVINIVSGQYVCQSHLFANTYVEVEMLGIPVDCSKKKTKTVKKNALNPIWNDTFFFKVMFHDLAFLKFSVYESDSNHLVSQRVIPLKCLRPGYRHVRLRSPTNQPLSMASLFVYSRVEEESLERLSDETDDFATIQEEPVQTGNESAFESAAKPSTSLIGANIPLKRRMFFLTICGVTDEPYTIFKIKHQIESLLPWGPPPQQFISLENFYNNPVQYAPNPNQIQSHRCSKTPSPSQFGHPTNQQPTEILAYFPPTGLPTGQQRLNVHYPPSHSHSDYQPFNGHHNLKCNSVRSCDALISPQQSTIHPEWFELHNNYKQNQLYACSSDCSNNSIKSWRRAN